MHGTYYLGLGGACPLLKSGSHMFYFVIFYIVFNTYTGYICVIIYVRYNYIRFNLFHIFKQIIFSQFFAAIRNSQYINHFLSNFVYIVLDFILFPAMKVVLLLDGSIGGLECEWSDDSRRISAALHCFARSLCEYERMMMKFKTASRGAINVALCVLDCDGVIFNSNRLKTAAYERTLSGMGLSDENVGKFVALHLSDVSVSRWVKFNTFFRDMMGLDEETCEKNVRAALDGYSSNCMKLYSELTPVKGALEFLAQTDPAATFVISGGAQTELLDVFESKGIAGNFAEIRGSPRTKIDHLQEILIGTGVSPDQVLFIGDGWTDFKCSKHHGVHFAFLKEMSDWEKHAEQMKGHESMVTECDSWKHLLARIEQA